VYDFNVFKGPDFPFNTGGNFRAGDYSAITLADDKSVYGGTQQSQNISGSTGDFQWGEPCSVEETLKANLCDDYHLWDDFGAQAQISSPFCLTSFLLLL
jgi:hypothetical protein